MKTVYRNPRAWRVRIAQATIWVGAGLCVWLAFFLPPNPADGPGDLIIAQAGAVLMICAAVAFEVYLRLYVIRIQHEGKTLSVTTLATLHHRRVCIDLAGASLGETRRERAPAFIAPGYDNSWRGLKAKGHMFPFIVDTTASQAEDF